MQLLDIANREITLTLIPEDALALATACRETLRHDLLRDSERGLYEACAALFDAAALAAAAHSYANLPDDWGLAKVQAELGSGAASGQVGRGICST